MKNLLFILILVSGSALAQKNFIDMPYLETSARVDTLVMPDRIYLKILLAERDSKGKTSTEDLERRMINRLTGLGIDVQKQLTVNDVGSNFRRYFLKEQQVMKVKVYTLLIYDADTAGAVIVALENEDISNVSHVRTEYSKMDKLKLELKSKALAKAKEDAIALLKSVGQKPGGVLYVSDMQGQNLLKGKASGVLQL